MANSTHVKTFAWRTPTLMTGIQIRSRLKRSGNEVEIDCLNGQHKIFSSFAESITTRYLGNVAFAETRKSTAPGFKISYYPLSTFQKFGQDLLKEFPSMGTSTYFGARRTMGSRWPEDCLLIMHTGCFCCFERKKSLKTEAQQSPKGEGCALHF